MTLLSTTTDKSVRAVAMESHSDIGFDLKDGYYKLIVDSAYNEANKLLLDLLLNKYKLIQRLK